MDQTSARLLAILADHPEGLSVAQLAALHRRVSVSRCSSAVQRLRVLGLAEAVPFKRGSTPTWRITGRGTAELGGQGS